MTNDVLQANIAVLGAGMTGASLVHLLAPARAAGLTVALIDRQSLSLSHDDWQTESDRPPSFDGRATALSWGTRQILEAMDVWSKLTPYACPIKHILVSDAGRFGQTHLHADEQATEALGYIIENRRLGEALLCDMATENNVECLSAVTVDQVAMNAGGCLLTLSDARSLQCRLLVMADGGRSPLLPKLGIDHHKKNYGAHALVTQVRCDQPHGHWAYERFSEFGPIAFLPLNSHDFAVVWTLSDDDVDATMALDDATLLAQLQPRIGHRVGRLTAMGERAVYPLAMMMATEQVRRSLVLLGNAAHSLHPVAGQGFNLALRDAAVLAEHLNEAARAGDDVGDLALLQRYLAQQQQDQRNTVAASDTLPRMFGSRAPGMAILRDAGLLGMAALPTLRRLFARHAMGLGHTAAKLG